MQRRSFLKTVTAGAALASQASLASALGANERIRIGLIGCGTRGKVFTDYVSAVCDPDEKRLAATAERVGVKPADAVSDLRRMLDDKSIDAVVIATPDHWHVPAALLALDAGKHVYVEKPQSHNLPRKPTVGRRGSAEQGRARRQAGNPQAVQQSVDPLAPYKCFAKAIIGHVLVREGVEYPDVAANIGHARSPPIRRKGSTTTLWVGPAEFMPFQKNRFHYQWHWWHNFGTGDIGNDGTHELDYARWGLGVDRLPDRVSAIGGKYFFNDQQEFPDTATCVYEYGGQLPDKPPLQLVFEMRLWSRNYPYNCDSGVEYRGTSGVLELSKRGKLRVLDEKNKVVLERRAEKHPGFPHMDNFLAAIRGEEALRADLTTAHRSVALVHLANISLAAGRTLNIDPENQTIVGDEQANHMLRRRYREGGHWSVPQQA